MLGAQQSITAAKETLDRKREKFDYAQRVNRLVNSEDWPKFKSWLEELMAQCYASALRETDAAKLGMMMGTWDTYRCLIAEAERHKDITDLRADLDRAHSAWQSKVNPK